MRLNSNELSSMKYLWSISAPASRGEIIEGVPDRPWSPDSFHLLINKLLKKGFVRVDGYITSSGHLGKNYAPTLSISDYLKTEMNSVFMSLPGMIAAFIDGDEISVLELEQFQAKIQKRLEQLKG